MDAHSFLVGFSQIRLIVNTWEIVFLSIVLPIQVKGANGFLPGQQVVEDQAGQPDKGERWKENWESLAVMAVCSFVMRRLGNRVQGCLSVCASVCWLIRWCGMKGRRGRNIACRACVNSRVYRSDEVVVLKGDLTGRLCKWWLMGSLESLFSQSNEVHLPGGENMKDRLWG